MDNANLYHKSNGLQKKDAIDVLDSFMHLLRWHSGDSVLDVGCGDGDITISVLVKRLPSDFGSLVGVDISPEMIKFATANFETDKIRFQVMDIGSPNAVSDICCSYDHVFSFNCLHWVPDQMTVMANMHKMMKKGGDMIISLIAKNHIFDIYKMMSRDPKWKPYMHDVDQYISPYNGSLNPAADLRKFLQAAGYKNIRVEYKHKKFCFKGLKILYDSVAAINPFLKNIPSSLHEDYMENYVELVKELGLIETDYSDPNETVIVNTLYSVLTAYATKD